MQNKLADLLNSALEHHRSGRLEEAGRIYQSIIADYPDHPDGWHLSGVLAHQTGDNNRAVKFIEKAIQINPGEPDFYINCAEAYRCLKDYSNALRNYNKALELRPDFAGAYNNIGNLYREKGDFETAIYHYTRAVELDPRFIIAHNNLGLMMKQSGDMSTAIEKFELAIRIEPNYAEAHNNLGNVFFELGKTEQSIVCYEKAISILPAYAEAHNNLGNARRAQGKKRQARKHYEDAIQFNPNFSMALVNLGIVIDEAGNANEAVSCFKKALSLDPGNAEAHYNMAFACQELGLKEKAIGHFNRVKELNPSNASVYLHLSLLSPDSITESEIEAQLRNPQIDKLEASQYQYSIANLHNRAHRYDKAFQHFQKANDLKRQTINYQHADFTRYVDRLIDIFDARTPDETENLPSQPVNPVFIVGMPRSGTTLVEQILSSHPDVSGAGELTTMDILEEQLALDLQYKARYPDCLRYLDDKTAARYAIAYYEELSGVYGKTRYLTDKNLGNFHRIGLLNQLFPDAKIIHCSRNPLDTCVSIFFNYFARGNNYAFNLEELGHYYADYNRLMNHWTAIYGNKIFEVSYENLVTEQVRTCSDMLNFLDLKWNDACKNFHTNKRAVRTASNLQVRQPIYTNSIGRWENYENELIPLIEILQAEGIVNPPYVD